MRLPFTTRLLALTVAVWFGCASCVMGCDMGLKLASAKFESAHHAHARPAEPGHEPDAHDCCEKPEGSDPAQPKPAGVMECCAKVTTAAVEKVKVKKAEPTATLASGVTSSLPSQAIASISPLLMDCSETYLRGRALRI